MPFQRHRLVLAFIALLAGAGCFFAPDVHRVLGRPLRAHGGDVAVTAFLFLTAGALTRLSRRARAAAVLVLALVVELSQLLPNIPRGGLLVELTLGSTFDPLDVLAYVAGLAIAIVVETRADRTHRAELLAR